MMKSFRALQRLQRVSAACLFVFNALCIQMCCVRVSFAEPPVAGSVRDISFQVGENRVGMRFVYVPAGTALVGRPGSEEREVNLSQAFYITANELTVKAFEDCLEEGDRRVHDQLERKFYADADRERIHREGDAYSATMISLEEAARVTTRLNWVLVTERSGKSGTLVTERVRLPTSAEWQYAMSCGSQERDRYINPWPGSAKNKLADRDLSRCQELWEKCGQTEKFMASPSQVTWLVETAQGNGGSRLEILSLLFPYLLDGRGDTTPAWRRFETKPEPVAEIAALAIPNDWGIGGCHRGYPEWVLAESSQASALRAWRRYEDNLASSSDKDSKGFRLCGSSSVVLDQADLTPLAKVFLSHERTMLSWNEAHSSSAAIVEDESVSMRLVLIECLSDAWRSVVRLGVSAAANAQVAMEQAATYEGEIRRLSSNAEQDIAYLQGYLGLQEYRTGNFADASVRIGGCADKLASRVTAAIPLESRLRKGGAAGRKDAGAQLSGDVLYFNEAAKLMAVDGTN
jgi:hypothetical protein